MNDKVYGLTAETVLFYSQMVECGFSWEAAMRQMKDLYEHNKAFALSRFDSGLPAE